MTSLTHASGTMSNFYESPGQVTTIRHRASARQTRIVIVGHHDFSVDGLASMLESHDNSYRVSCIEPGHAGLAALAGTANLPDALLMQNEALQEPLERFIHDIVEKYPAIRILVFGKNMDDDHLYRLVRAGVHGYINERMSGDHIKHALDCIMQGNAWIERHILERFIATQHDFDQVLEAQIRQKISQLCTSLTKRETEILAEVVQGLAIKQIAEQVHLSHQGVKMHLAKLFKKFKVSNRNQLILAALDQMSPVEDLSALLRTGLKNKLRSTST